MRQDLKRLYINISYSLAHACAKRDVNRTHCKTFLNRAFNKRKETKNEYCEGVTQ